MKQRNRIIVRNAKPPVIEIDTASASAYVRFQRGAKVAKTKTISSRGSVVCAADFDAAGEVIGFELVGVKQFSIAKIMASLPEEARNHRFFGRVRTSDGQTAREFCRGLEQLLSKSA